MAKKGGLKGDGLSHDLSSPEEFGEGTRPPRGGREARHEGGFAEGEHGRGPNPYRRGHSGPHVNGQSLDVHGGTSGRGGSGIIGKGDGHKGHSEDIEHPSSHEEFEALGGVDGGAGGRD